MDGSPKESRRPGLVGQLDVGILSLATAVPENVISQDIAVKTAKDIFPQFARLEDLYVNTGIERRYSCVPEDWLYREHGWEERTELFQRHALELLERVALDAIARAGLELADIDGLVVNTVTGLAIPSLDAMLLNRLDFRPDVERLPIFGFGCGGGVAGLGRAARLTHAMPDSNVLFLTVDLCTLCARANDPSMAMFVSAALFGDGAAGVVLRNRPPDKPGTGTQVGGGRILAVGEHFWRDTKHIMGWDITGDGFGVVLSPDLIHLVRNKFGPAIQAFLAPLGLTLSDFDGFVFHPGGSKVLQHVEGVLGLERDDLRHSWNVLRDYGNMSSATALFVLDEAMRQGASGLQLIVAFGPGFSAYFVVAEL